MPQHRPKLLCTRCQFRKLQCSRTEPCSNCANSGQECEYREQSKRRPISRLCVTGLEDRIAWLENLVNRLKVANQTERDRILETIDLGDHLEPHPEPELGTDEPDILSHASHFLVESDGLLSYHGPTSIYRFSTTLSRQDQRRPLLSHTMPDNADDQRIRRVAQDFGIDL